jgi:Ca2+-binding EF-hand superfamily protein
MKPGQSLIFAASLLLAWGVSGRLMAADGDAELEKFAEGLLRWDDNGNGWLDGAELAEAGNRYPQIVVSRFSEILRSKADENLDSRLSAEERKLVLAPSASAAASWRRKFDLLDVDHDGRLSRKEASGPSRGQMIQSFFSESSDPRELVRRLLLYQITGKEIPDAIGNQADVDGNGYLDPAETLAAEALVLQQFDADGNGSLDAAERLARAREAGFQDSLYRLCPDADKDNNSWLSAAEVAAALAQVMPVYDANKNGRLDDDERAMVIRDGPCAWPREALVNQLSRDPMGMGGFNSSDEGLAAAAIKYGGTGSDHFGIQEIYNWRRQREDQSLQTRQNAMVEWLGNRLESQMNPAWDGESRSALYKKRLVIYDANQDGKLDGREFCRFMLGDLFLDDLVVTVSIQSSGSYSTSYVSQSYGWFAVALPLLGIDVNNGGSGDRQALLPLLFFKVDADNDGLFTPDDAKVIKSRFAESRRQRMVGDALAAFLASTRGDPNVRMPLAAREKELDTLKQRFDLDKNGKFSAGELQALTVALDAEISQSMQSRWLDKLGRFADADGDGRLDDKEKILAAAMMRFIYDRDKSGSFDKDEITQMQSDLQQQDYYDQERQRRMQQDKALLQRYDLDGDGKIGPTERARADADRRRQQESRVTAPPLDD